MPKDEFLLPLFGGAFCFHSFFRFAKLRKFSLSCKSRPTIMETILLLPAKLQKQQQLQSGAIAAAALLLRFFYFTRTILPLPGLRWHRSS